MKRSRENANMESPEPTPVNYSMELLRREYDERRPIRSALAAVVLKRKISNADILELGSGLGFNLDLFATDNRVLGVEGLESAAASANQRGIPTAVADLERQLPIEPDSFDVVLCLDVLEHLSNPRKCLLEARRVLRAGGVVIVNVPNHFTLGGRLRILMGSGVDSRRFFPDHPDWGNPHLRFFRRASIGSLLTCSGFCIVDDWCSRLPAVPVLQRVRGLEQTKVASYLAGRFPDLFAGGFFLVAVKS